MKECFLFCRIQMFSVLRINVSVQCPEKTLEIHGGSWGVVNQKMQRREIYIYLAMIDQVATYISVISLKIVKLEETREI